MGAQNNIQPFDIYRISEEMNISVKSIENCQIPLEELEKIYYDHIAHIPDLERQRVEILATLTERASGVVHSIRSRVKEPDHLIGKIVRGAYSNPGKYHLINAQNYRKIITDLIGLRIIILDRRDWKIVHQNLLTIYRNIPERYVHRYSDILTNYDLYTEEVSRYDTVPGCAYHAERPVGYITTEEDRKLYKDEFLLLDSSKAHYRSLHYIIRYKDVYFEMQMRSLFEEGWLEFDHRMKYPNDRYNKRKEEYIGILSNLANAADQLISYYREEDFEDHSENMQEEEMHMSSARDRTLAEGDLEEKIRILF